MVDAILLLHTSTIRYVSANYIVGKLNIAMGVGCLIMHFYPLIKATVFPSVPLGEPMNMSPIKGHIWKNYGFDQRVEVHFESP